VLNSHPKAKYKVSACKETNKTNTCIQTWKRKATCVT
jgi:hypothetical protein